MPSCGEIGGRLSIREPMRLLPPSARERRATVRLLETTNLLSRADGSETTTTRADAKVEVDDLKPPLVSAL